MKMILGLIIVLVSSVGCGSTEPQNASQSDPVECLIGVEACAFVPGTPLSQWENIDVEVYARHSSGRSEVQGNLLIQLMAKDVAFCPWPPEATATINGIDADLIAKLRPTLECGTVMVWELSADRWPTEPAEETIIVISDDETNIAVTVPKLLERRSWAPTQQLLSRGGSVTLNQSHDETFQLPAMGGGVKLVPDVGDARLSCVTRNSVCTVVPLEDFIYSEGSLVIQIPNEAPIGAARLEFRSRLRIPSTCSVGCGVQLQVDSSVGVEIVE